MSTTNYIIRDVAGVDTTLDASQVLWTARATINYTVLQTFVGSTEADYHLVGIVPAGAVIVAGRLLLRQSFAGSGMSFATLSLGGYSGDPDNLLVKNFDGRGSVGSQGTVGNGEPFDQSPTGIYLTLQSDILMETLSAGLVAVQIHYCLPTV